jgi:hypothetical protein
MVRSSRHVRRIPKYHPRPDNARYAQFDKDAARRL